VILKEDKPCSKGFPWVKARKKMKKKDEASTQNHGGTRRDSRAYEVLHHGNQMENKALTRIPMEGILYHINYDTLIKKET
jgi:hypothetical protein